MGTWSYKYLILKSRLALWENWVFQLPFTLSLYWLSQICFVTLLFGYKNTNYVVSILLLNKSTVQHVPQRLLFLPNSDAVKGNDNDLFLNFSSIVIYYSVIFEEFIEHLVSCSRHSAGVAPSPVPSYGKRDHQRRLIDLFANEGLQNVNDESDPLWMWTWFIYSSLIFKFMCNLWKIQFMFDLCPLNHQHIIF